MYSGTPVTGNRHPLPTIATISDIALSLTGDQHDPIKIMVEAPSGSLCANLFVNNGKVYHVAYSLFYKGPAPDEADTDRIKALVETKKDALLQCWIDTYILHKNYTTQTLNIKH
jgi:hypothetical protein